MNTLCRLLYQLLPVSGVGLAIALLAAPLPALAQSITPANDGTGTVVDQTGNRYTITGGSRSRDGSNLFHSFEQLGLDTDEIASFLSQPNILNILGRVTGGDASFIDGLLQLRGGNSNLYLINPAGIVFGSNAQLNLPASFFATSANGIGFGDAWFDALGDNSYATLVGTPDSFAFSLAEPGSVINLGDLAVNSGSTLALLGGTVLNAGTLAAPDGRVTLAAIPGGNRVRLSQAGSLLSLDLEPLTPGELSPARLSPLSLPELLTGGEVSSATAVTVNPDGTVRLGGSNVAVQPGMAIATGTLDVSGAGRGEIAVVGDRVGLFDATLNASGTEGGGSIRLGGDYQGNGTVFNANRTYVSADSQLLANAIHSGDGGRIIVWADEATRFYGSLSARGGANGGDGGFAEVSGLQSLDFAGTADLGATLGETGTLLLDPENITIIDGPSDPTQLAANDQFGDPGITNIITNGTISAALANVILQATNTIVFNAAITITADGVGLTAQANTIQVNTDIRTNGGDIRLEALQGSNGQIQINGVNLDSSGGDIFLLANGDITATGSLLTGDFITLTRNSGDIIARSFSGDINLDDINVTSSAGTDGGIDLRADSGSIFIAQDIVAASALEAGTSITTNDLFGDSIELTSNQGSINTGDIFGGSIELTSNQGSINTGDIFGDSTELTSNQGSVNIGDLSLFESLDVRANTGITTGVISTAGADVRLEARGDIQVDWIDTSPFSPQQRGGSVTILTEGFFRAISSLSSSSSSSSSGERFSINTSGEGGGGDILIRHGGNGNVPFTIGGDFGHNGTLAAITNGEFTVEEGESFSNSFTRGNIRIETGGGFDDDCTVDCEGDDSEPEPPTEEALDLPTVRLAQADLATIQAQSGVTPALVYISFVSSGIPLNSDFEQREAIANQQITNYLGQTNPTESPLLTASSQDTDELEILMVLSNGEPIRQRVSGVTRADVLAAQQTLLREITNPTRLRSTRYLTSAQQLYDWLIRPIEASLDEEGIDNLAFIMDAGLRMLPIATLHDGNQFLVERYSVGLMPSLSLTDSRYVDIRDLPVLAMGASQFETLSPLPAVPVELAAITSDRPNSVSLFGTDFTPENLLSSRRAQPFGIVHLATHAEFLPGSAENSYIQFGDRPLPLSQLRQLQLNNPPIELLVLSACKTALGDAQAELGFGGLAVQTGARSALASLWYVSDTGTLSFMTEFYRQLQQAPVRAEAVRQTQISLLRGEISIVDDQLQLPDGSTLPLPPELANNSGINLTHPYFWAAFTLIGSPW